MLITLRNGLNVSKNFNFLQEKKTYNLELTETIFIEDFSYNYSWNYSTVFVTDNIYYIIDNFKKMLKYVENSDCSTIKAVKYC